MSPDLTLVELGLDSMILIEIQQTLERDNGVSMSAKEIRELTFAKLDQLSAAGDTAPSTSKAVSQAPSSIVRYDLRHLCPSEAVVEMNNLEMEASPLFVIPPIVDSVLILSNAMSKIQTVKVYGFQCTEDTPLTSIADMASHYIKVAASVFFCFICKFRFYLSHCYTIAWDRLSNQFLFVCVCMY